MNSNYLSVSAMYFMQFAVWGAWMPVLAARLLGPLKMTGKQTGWIYATFPLASIVSPLFFGQLADKSVDAAWIMAGCHLAGAVLMFFAARTDRFAPLFVVMLLYSMAYAATLSLANAVLLRHAADPVHGYSAPYAFIWAPVAWALVGYFLTGLRQMKGTGNGSDCLYLAAILSMVTAAVCLVLPASPPQGQAGQPMMDALSMLKEPNYLLFMVVSMFVAGTMQFYFLGTAPFMQEMGISSKNVPGAMAMAQAMQAAATLFALGYVYDTIGPRWTLALGAASWLALYGVYMIGRPTALIVVSQVFHGLAYVLFIMGGWTYVSKVAPPEINNSAQSLIILITMGIGLFVGTQAAGFFMERAKVGDRFQWGRVWIVPLIVTLAGTLALVGAFKAPPVVKKPEAKEAAVASLAPPRV